MRAVRTALVSLALASPAAAQDAVGDPFVGDPFVEGGLAAELLARLGAGPAAADPPQPDKDADPPDSECPADGLQALGGRGLAVQGERRVVVAPPPGGSMRLTAALCRDVQAFARGVPLLDGVPTRVWMGDGRDTDVVLYRDFREVGRLTISLDPTLPAPPPVPTVAAVAARGLVPAFRPETTRYTVPAVRGDRLPLTIATAEPGVAVFVNGQAVEPGRTHHAWAPPGSRVEVVSYRDWVEESRYTLQITDYDLDPQSFDFAGSLYLAGGAGIERIRVANDAHTHLAVPNPGKTFMLAVDDTGDRLYATSNGAQDSLTVVDLGSHQVVDQTLFGDTWALGALAVAPGGLMVHVFDLKAPVMATLDAHDVGTALGVDYLWGVGMPAWAGYRPGSIDLYVTDFWDVPGMPSPTPTPIAVRRAGIDWQTNSFVFWWEEQAFPLSQTNTDGNAGAGLAFLTEQDLVVAANTRGDELVVLDEATGQPLAQISTGAMPFFVTVDPGSDADEGRVLVAGLQAGSLGAYTVQRPPTGGAVIQETARLNPCATGDAVKPVFGADPTTLFVLCTDGVAVLDAATLAVKRHIPVDGAAYFTDMVWAPH